MKKANKKHKIAVITGTRAEYWILKPLINEIKNDPDLKLQLIVTGAHLVREFGNTVTDIEKDGFDINERIDILTSSVTDGGITNSDVSVAMGNAMINAPGVWERLNPDVVVVLGDRYEILALAASAHVCRIPVAHIHGGEITEGAFDDAFRHAITKMSHFHFTATEEYRKRVVQLGESPDRVFNTGALALDTIKTLKILSKKELEKKLKFTFNKHNVLVTFHPVTLENDSAIQLQNLLSVLDKLEETHIIFTKANADPGGSAINKIIEEYVSENLIKSVVFSSMGHLRYFSAMQYVDAVVGNSSSGIIEAPSFKIGTINIGDRQKGRMKAESVIDCTPAKNDIIKAFKKLYSENFQTKIKSVSNPYDGQNTARKIVYILKSKMNNLELKKEFYDIDFKIIDKEEANG
ncbi:MAG: UDP-N-acetylglucosamine 2-epimerase [Proteobacteria bacterium]|nr:UDP-N-acetylglucosamine 2-epimerase [Pseudomonadota bacterium]